MVLRLSTFLKSLSKLTKEKLLEMAMEAINISIKLIFSPFYVSFFII